MKICVLPGDGIGPEIMAEAVRVLKALDLTGFEMEEALLGGCAVDATGDPYPEATQKLAQEADAVLLGAVGGPQVGQLPREQRPERGLLGIRKQLGLFANLRPAILYPELANASTLKPEVVAGLDILIVRELTGDIYFGQPRGIEMRDVDGRSSASASTPCTTPKARSAASACRLRGGAQAQRKVCSVDKMNVLECTQLWRDVAIETGEGVSGCRAQPHAGGQRRDATGEAPEAVRRDGHRQHVRRHPVRRSLDADRLDRHAALGLAGRQQQGPVRAFSHGSAPDIAGKGVANPLATILSVAMMLRYTLPTRRRQRIEAAVKKVLAQGFRTGDIYEPGTTRRSVPGKWATRYSRRCNSEY
jgi:3-isopropylmalate dehydrogenase